MLLALLLHTLALGPAAGALSSVSSPVPDIVVLAVELNNLTNTLPDTAEQSRLEALTAALRQRLASACGYRVPELDRGAATSASRGPGYFYAHPELAAELGRAAGADWVLVPRLNRASPWVTDLQLHVVRARDGVVVSNRIVEIKGFGMTPELTTALTRRGSAWMADQVAQVIDRADGDSPSAERRCRA